MNTQFTRYAGWAAYLSGIFALLGFVSEGLFFGLQGPQAPASGGQAAAFFDNLATLFFIGQMLALLIVAHALYESAHERAPSLSQVARAIGVVGVLALALLQILMLAKVMSFRQEFALIILTEAVVGIWLILVNYLARAQATLPARLAWLGIAVGAAFVLALVIFSAMGGSFDVQKIMSNYLLLIGSALVYLVTYVGFPIWAIWLGRVLTATNRESTLTPSTEGARVR